MPKVKYFIIFVLFILALFANPISAYILSISPSKQIITTQGVVETEVTILTNSNSPINIIPKCDQEIAKTTFIHENSQITSGNSLLFYPKLNANLPNNYKIGKILIKQDNTQVPTGSYKCFLTTSFEDNQENTTVGTTIIPSITGIIIFNINNEQTTTCQVLGSTINENDNGEIEISARIDNTGETDLFPIVNIDFIQQDNIIDSKKITLPQVKLGISSSLTSSFNTNIKSGDYSVFMEIPQCNYYIIHEFSKSKIKSKGFSGVNLGITTKESSYSENEKILVQGMFKNNGKNANVKFKLIDLFDNQVYYSEQIIVLSSATQSFNIPLSLKQGTHIFQGSFIYNEYETAIRSTQVKIEGTQQESLQTLGNLDLEMENQLLEKTESNKVFYTKPKIRMSYAIGLIIIVLILTIVVIKERKRYKFL